VVNAGTRAKDLAWIELQAQAFEVQVKERPEFAMIAVQGPAARAKVLGLLHEVDRQRIEKLGKFAAAAAQGPHGMPLFVARTGYTGEDGFEIVVPPSMPSPCGKRWLRRVSRRPASARATPCAWRRA
jgi:aminomethyltransferase